MKAEGGRLKVKGESGVSPLLAAEAASLIEKTDSNVVESDIWSQENFLSIKRRQRGIL